MSSFATCPSCKKKLRLPDLPARRDSAADPDAEVVRPCKCPACGTTFRGVLHVASPRSSPLKIQAVSSDKARAAPKRAAVKRKAVERAEEVELDEEVASEEEVDRVPRKAKRRRKRKSGDSLAWLGQTLFILGPMHVTPTKLTVAGLLLVPLVWFAIALNPLAPVRPTAQRVEIIRTPFRAPRIADPRTPPASLTFFDLMRRSDVVVTRPHPQGDIMLATVPISGQQLDKMYGAKSTIASIPKRDIKLLCNGEVIEPICLLAMELKKSGASWYCRTKDGGISGAYLEPPEQLSATQKSIVHDSEWKIQSDAGLLVQFMTDAEKDEARLTWDEKSTGWKGALVADRTSSLSDSWEVKCLFAKPANASNMQIQVWSEPPQPLVLSD